MKRKFLFAAKMMAVLPAGAGFAQTGIVSQGRAIAVSTCSQCHSIGLNENGSKNSAAPSFQAIAGMASATQLSLKVFLRSPHANMPAIIMSDSDLDAIVDYILSLRKN